MNDSPMRQLASQLASITGDLAELNGRLSPAEHAFVPEATFDAYAADRRIRQDMARKILDRELDGITYDDLRADPTRGEVAQKLYATWADINADEPVVECRYARKPKDRPMSGLQADLMTAMGLHGRPAWTEACRILGESIANAAIDYVLETHEDDAEQVMLSRQQDEDRR